MKLLLIPLLAIFLGRGVSTTIQNRSDFFNKKDTLYVLIDKKDTLVDIGRSKNNSIISYKIYTKESIERYRRERVRFDSILKADTNEICTEPVPKPPYIYFRVKGNIRQIFANSLKKYKLIDRRSLGHLNILLSNYVFYFIHKKSKEKYNIREVCPIYDTE